VSRIGQDWAFKDETGKLYGGWKVLGRVVGGNGARWRCECERCGSTRVFYGYALRSGNVAPCKHPLTVGRE
jgi:hypothetical protein